VAVVLLGIHTANLHSPFISNRLQGI